VANTTSNTPTSYGDTNGGHHADIQITLVGHIT
jgi:hypothetical protein